MAPTTRSSVHGSRPGDLHDIPGGTEEGEFESEHELLSSEVDDDMMEDSDEIQFAHPARTSAQELLRPLQETADRVSRQVEEFAQTLDKFNVSSKRLEGQELWQETWLLMDQYARSAEANADRIQSKPTTKQTQKNRKSLGDTTTQKQNLYLESDLWTLTAQTLPCKSPDLMQGAEFKQYSALAGLHRYSTDAELWNAFIEVDVIAMQYEVLLEWLQEWKRKTSTELVDTDLDSYDQAHRGDGLWSGGDCFTLAPIKKQKVARAHDGPLQPSPDIRRIHLRTSDNEPLVTQMDPDATTRQDGAKEVEDEAYELSAWHACWEMLRRGQSSQDSRSRWTDRGELWRSLLLRNGHLHSDPNLSKSGSRIANLASNPEYLAWLKTLIEEDVQETKYERAVYGIICGNYAAALPVCKTIDDNFFALVNELLIERYERFLTAFQQRLLQPDVTEYRVPQSTINELSRSFSSALITQSTKDEAHQPHKYLQGMLISDDIPTFFIELGRAAAQMAYLTGQSRILFDDNNATVSESAKVAAQDEEIVRIAVHLQLALQPLGLLDGAYTEDALAMENNIINYVGLLERHAKYTLLPLYVSKLSEERQPRILGRILSRVTEPRERDMQMRLMKQYQIPVYRVIYTICDYARRTWCLQLSDSWNPVRVTEYKDRIVRIRAGFIGDVATDEESRLVQAHEWINYIDSKNWGMAVWLMTALYKALLMSGKLWAAKELVERVGLSTTSLKVTGMNLSLVAVSNGDDNWDDDVDEEDDLGERLASPTKRRKEPKLNHPLAKETTDRSQLAEQSLIWAQLEHLVQALDALELWQDLADQVESLPRNDMRSMKVAKKELSQALQTVHQAMQPLLEQDFLNNPNDEQEDDDLTQIRNHYLPECILAYNSALYFGGHAITRQHLVQCMDLAQHVAKNNTLTQAFVASRRMQELVTAFALDSQALLRANEHGTSNTRGRGGKRSSAGGDRGGRADIWQVTWKDE